MLKVHWYNVLRRENRRVKRAMNRVRVKGGWCITPQTFENTHFDCGKEKGSQMEIVFHLGMAQHKTEERTPKYSSCLETPHFRILQGQ